MKELQLGFIHKKDLAEWFGRSPQYFMKDSKAFHRYCDKLYTYADFKIVRGGVEILEIYNKVYTPNLDIDLTAECIKVLSKAPDSKLIKGGKIGTAPAIAYEICKILTTEQQELLQHEKTYQAFVQTVRRTLNKLYGSKPMERYWVYYKDGERIEVESDGSEGCKVSIPLIKTVGDNSVNALRELTKEEEDELNALIREEEENDAEHSTFQAYQIMQDVAEGYYKGDEKELRQEIMRQNKPFYRAMKRFNAKYGIVYINRGTVYIKRERD